MTPGLLPWPSAALLPASYSTLPTVIGPAHVQPRLCLAPRPVFRGTSLPRVTSSAMSATTLPVDPQVEDQAAPCMGPPQANGNASILVDNFLAACAVKLHGSGYTEEEAASICKALVDDQGGVPSSAHPPPATSPGANKMAENGTAPAVVQLWHEAQGLADRQDGTSTASTSAAGGTDKQASTGMRRPRIATQLVHPRKALDDPYMAMSTPLYQTATFGQPSATTFGPYDYTRSGNPTRAMLETQMADLEGGDRAFAFASGMAALAALARLVANGEHILTGDDIYGGTSRLLARVVPGAGVNVSNVDMTDLSAVEAGIVPGRTKLVLVESPTNPRMQVCDIRAIADIAHAAGAVVCVDNSIMAPVFQRPLDLGADISMTSATKFIGGHSDITGGILTVKGPELADRIYFIQNAVGAILGPFDCWLALRGLKTMALRMERQAANCAALAWFLAAHPLVQRVNYAGLPSHPGAQLHARQATSGGSLLSFTTGDVEVSKVIVEETKLFNITVSFGSVSSLMTLPCYMSHASIPAEVRVARGLPDDLVRISAGVEDIDDLLADLGQAMDKAVARAKR